VNAAKQKWANSPNNKMRGSVISGPLIYSAARRLVAAPLLRRLFVGVKISCRGLILIGRQGRALAGNFHEFTCGVPVHPCARLVARGKLLITG
jgi:hypothetical protein